MTPLDLLNTRYGHVQLLHVGHISLGETKKELAVYAARVQSRNLIPYNLVIALTPKQLAKQKQVRLRDTPWVSLYLRSYFKPEQLNAAMPLDWDAVLGSEEQPVNPQELPGDMWIKELDRSLTRSKCYAFADPRYSGSYVVGLESRASENSQGFGLKPEYEFDLLLNHNNFNLAIEHL